MSEDEHQEQEQGGAPAATAVRALAGAAVAGAATYAVRRALSARDNGDDRAREDGDESPTSSRSEPEDSADDTDEDVEDKPSAEPSRRTGGTRSKLQLVSSSALAAATPALVPLVERAADSAGRYVAEHAPEIVRDHVIPQFIDAFEKAS